jgi:hypothetical protein
MRFFHQGQLEGRRRRISPHLGRWPDEPRDDAVAAFYEQLLAVLRRPVLRSGRWQLSRCDPTFPGDHSHDAFIAFAWSDATERLLVVVNFSAKRGQCFVRLPFDDLDGSHWLFRDVLSDVELQRAGSELHARGLYLDAPPWQAHVFSLQRL